MKLREDIRPITHLKTRAADVIKQVNKTRRPVVITQNGVAQAVLQDVDSYEKTLESLAMLQIILQGKDAREAGDVVDQDKMFADLKAKLLKRKSKATHVA